MKSPIDSRARFVETTAVLLRRQGYHATGLSQIIERSGAPKGSLYFHFPGGKEALAQAALEHSSDSMHEGLRALVTGAATPLDALRAVCGTLADELESSEFLDGCPVATVALEAAAHSAELQSACSASYRRWEVLIAESLQDHGLSASEAGGRANVVLCAVEGALLLSRAHRDTAALRGLPEQLAPLFR